MTDDPLAPFLAQEAGRPDAIAVQQDGRSVSYGALAAMARRLARRLADVADRRVLIALPQGPEAYAAMLGTLLGGGTYVPVNVDSPIARLRRVAALVQPGAVLAKPGLLAALAPALDHQGLRITPDLLGTGDMLAGDGTRHDDAYVIFTSGSTGEPKGVVIPQAALAHYVGWLDAEKILRADDRVSQFPNIAFDLSVLDIFGALGAGATLVAPSASGERVFPADFARRVGISVWVSVPSMFALAVSARQATARRLGGIRLFLFCGEKLLRSHLEHLFAACPQATVMNLYGPTEATCSMTAMTLRRDEFASLSAGSAAIGAPIAGMGLHLHGGAHADEGEIVITGPQLARGYWQDAPRTAAVFRTVQVGAECRRGYHTGDWGERRDGLMFVRQRLDRQIKIHGFRVEIDEVQAAIACCGHPICCVLLHAEVLTAVIEQDDGSPFDPLALRARLLEALDRYAVPDVIHAIGRLPRNSNDKVDEAAVLAWLMAQAEADEERPPPRAWKPGSR